MIDRLMKYEKAWAEFKKWMLEQYALSFGMKYNMSCFLDEDNEIITHYERDALIIEFLDSKGIYVLPYLEWDGANKQFSFDCSIKNKSNNHLTLASSINPSRQSATKAGVEKAFEILEQQLKEREK